MSRRLHVGAGRERMEGWINLDIQDLPGVDVVADATQGLEFQDLEAVYAEHFLEHLPVDKAVDFLAECHRVLAPGGWLRLSTPNLDWVWSTHYRLGAPAAEKVERAVMINRAFHGWRHRFLWNREILGRALAACGFDEIRWCRWGESSEELFRGIERHATYEDDDELPHVIIAEACKGEARPGELAELRGLLAREFLAHQAD